MMPKEFVGILPRRFTPNLEARHNSSQFTRRHYIWLASALREVYDRYANGKHFIEKNSYAGYKPNSSELYAVQIAIEIFTEILAADNPNFNRDQFLANIFGESK